MKNVTKKELTPFHTYTLYYSDKDTQDVEIRLEPKQAEEYYVGQSFAYWDASTNTEKEHTVVLISHNYDTRNYKMWNAEELKVGDSVYITDNTTDMTTGKVAGFEQFYQDGHKTKVIEKNNGGRVVVELEHPEEWTGKGNPRFNASKLAHVPYWYSVGCGEQIVKNWHPTVDEPNLVHVDGNKVYCGKDSKPLEIKRYSETSCPICGEPRTGEVETMLVRRYEKSLGRYMYWFVGLRYQDFSEQFNYCDTHKLED